MSVLRPDDNSSQMEDITFLYRLVLGHAQAQHSYGWHCALLAGVPDEVIERAEVVLDAETLSYHNEEMNQVQLWEDST
ncbi:hypothetical protein K1719_014090 [Acacia pycnantha]|nr:hypothetical protein K1719_014090 [Acacia pycnantha]